jgi:hypothetical protein
MKTMLMSLVAFSLSLSAADFTGKWAGTYELMTPDGQAQKGNVVLTLAQNGSEVTGTVAADDNQPTQIAKGHAEGNEVTFESQTPDTPVMKVTLHLEAEHLKGVAKGDDGGDAIEAKVDLTRKADQ